MKKRNSLGTGLGTLLGHSSTQRSVEHSVEHPDGDQTKAPTITHSIQSDVSPTHLPITQLNRASYQPRREIPLDTLQELTDSIRAQGIIQPIIVRALPSKGLVAYEIIAGERRFRAAQLAGLVEVPVVIRAVSDSEALAMALIENIQREDLSPLEEANALQRLMQDCDLTHQETAEAVGKSRVTVTNLLRLLTLPIEIKQLLDKGELEMGHARALLSLPGPQQYAVAKMVV